MDKPLQAQDAERWQGDLLEVHWKSYPLLKPFKEKLNLTPSPYPCGRISGNYHHLSRELKSTCLRNYSLTYLKPEERWKSRI